MSSTLEDANEVAKIQLQKALENTRKLLLNENQRQNQLRTEKEEQTAGQLQEEYRKNVLEINEKHKKECNQLENVIEQLERQLHFTEKRSLKHGTAEGSRYAEGSASNMSYEEIHKKCNNLLEDGRKENNRLVAEIEQLKAQLDIVNGEVRSLKMINERLETLIQKQNSQRCEPEHASSKSRTNSDGNHCASVDYATVQTKIREKWSIEQVKYDFVIIRVKSCKISHEYQKPLLSHASELEWCLKYTQDEMNKRVYSLKCDAQSFADFNFWATVTMKFMKRDGSEGIQRSVKTRFHNEPSICNVKIWTTLPFDIFDETYPNVEVHVNISEAIRFPRDPVCMWNVEKDDQLTDVTLIVEQKRLYCNKSVLATFSPVFRAMFFSGFKESTENRVVLKDIEQCEFSQFLMFMLTPYSEMDDDEVESNLVLADRFNVEIVVEKCVYALLMNMVCGAERMNEGPDDKEVLKIKGKMIDFDMVDEHLRKCALDIEGKKLYVNKAVLATFSPVFRSIFYTESAQSTNNTFVIKDVNYDDFEQFLQVIHSAYPSINVDNIDSLLMLADRFDVPVVLEKCERYIYFTDDFNIIEKLNFADQYSLDYVHNKCMESFDTRDELEQLCTELDRFGTKTLQRIIKKLYAQSAYYSNRRYRRFMGIR